MKRHFIWILLILIALCFVAGEAEGRVLLEKEWRWVDATPANLAAAGVKAIHLLPYVGGANNDDLQISAGSPSLNSVNAENWNKDQLTIRVWVRLNFVPGDGVAHLFFDNQGTGEIQNRIRCLIIASGSLRFQVYDKDSTRHHVTYDASSWTIDSAHQIVVIIDFKNDAIRLYVDGALEDDTPDNALSSDSIDTIETNTHFGSDTNAANQLNGAIVLQGISRSWTNAEVTADWDSGDGTAFVVDPDTLFVGKYGFAVEDPGIVYMSAGKSGTTDNADFTTTIGVIGKDNDAIRISDATGYNVQGFIDGTPSGTTIGHDDGAGSPITDVEKVGVSIDCDTTHSASAANNTIHDLTNQDLCFSALVKIDSDSGDNYEVVSKLSLIGWSLNALYGTARMYTREADADVYTLTGNTDIRDNCWHHVALVFDRDTEANCKIYLDGYEDGTTNRTGVLGDMGSITSPAIFGILSTFDGQIRDVKIYYAVGDVWSDAEILYQATHPHNVGASAGTITEYYDIDENTGTTIGAGVTSPGNDLTLSNTAAWTQSAFLSRNFALNPGFESQNIGGTTVGSNWTITPDTNVIIRDLASLKTVAATADDGDSSTIFNTTLTNAQEYRLSFETRISAIHANSNVLIEVNGAATPIVSRQFDTGTDDRGIAYALNTTNYWELSFTADQAAITIELVIEGEPEITAATRTVNTGTESSGSLSDTETQNGTDYVITEEVGAPGADFEFTFNVNGVGKSFNIYGYYDGNAGHTVDVNAWNGSGWDTLDQWADEVADSLHTYTLSATHTNAGVVRMQIDHTSPGNVNHDFFMDHLYVIDSIDATLYLDQFDLRELVAGDSLSGDKYYTLFYNVDTVETGSLWSGLGSDATEVKSGDLYFELDEADASVATKGDGLVPINQPFFPGDF